MDNKERNNVAIFFISPTEFEVTVEAIKFHVLAGPHFDVLPQVHHLRFYEIA